MATVWLKAVTCIFLKIWFILICNILLLKKKKLLINLREQNGIEDMYFFKIDNDLFWPEIRVVGNIEIVDIGLYFS